MIRINEEEVDSSFEEVRIGSLSDYLRKDPRNLPTHFSLTLQKNGFDKVRYYKTKIL